MSLQVELLENSFEAVKPQADEFVNSFYENLFTANPEAKPLFDTTNMAEQKKKLLNSLVLVVENLRQPDVLDKALRGLGARHVKYGALPEHYPLVGSALLTTFEQYLGDKWTSNVKQAWVDAYGAISEIMLDGADYSEVDIALKQPASNTEMSQPLAYTTSNTEASLNSHGAVGEMVMNPDNGKAGILALAGGGIMGIIATILALLL